MVKFETSRSKSRHSGRELAQKSSEPVIAVSQLFDSEREAKLWASNHTRSAFYMCRFSRDGDKYYVEFIQ